jgi:hypothetical protein
MDLAELKAQASRSTYVMGKYVLGYDKFCDPHKHLSAFIDNPHKRYPDEKTTKVVLAPRGCFKTTLAVDSYVTRKVAANPNIRILIFSSEYGLARSSLRNIRGHFQKNELLRQLWGNHVGNTNWRDDYIYSAKRTKQLKDPTVGTGGTDAALEGFHYDIIVVDDMHGFKNTQNIEQIEKVKEKYALLYPILDPGGEIIVVGTIWHHQDKHTEFLRCNACGNPATDIRGVHNGTCSRCGHEFPYSLYYMPAWDGDLEGEHTLNFPTILTTQSLLDEKGRMNNAYQFSCQYALYPMADEDVLFSKDWFRYIKREDLPADAEVCVIMDPASGRKKGTSNTAVAALAVRPSGQIFLLQSSMGKWDEDEKARQVIQAVERWGASEVGVEVTGSSDAAEVMDRELRRANLWTPVVKLHHHNRPKAERIAALQPEYKRGKMFHMLNELNEKPSGIVVYEDNLVNCSRTIIPSGSDDVDAVSMVTKMPCYTDGIIGADSIAPIDTNNRLDVLERRSAEREFKNRMPTDWMAE